MITAPSLRPFALLVFTSWSIIFGSTAEALAPAAMSTAQKMAFRASVTYQCGVSRYSGEAANPAKPFVDSYPHCFKMMYRQPGQSYSFNVPGCDSTPGCGSTPNKIITIPASDIQAADQNTQNLPSDADGTKRSYAYFESVHLWCLDPNPPTKKVHATDPDSAPQVPISTCRPFAFTLCSDPSGVALKTAQLAQMPSHLCGPSLYNARWHQLMPDPTIPPP